LAAIGLRRRGIDTPPAYHVDARERDAKSFTIYHELPAVGVLLDPGAGAPARLIGGVHPLGDDALQAPLAGWSAAA
jgi:hypothetical protein